MAYYFSVRRGWRVYHSCNPAGEEKVFCIGDTTAEAAQRYWKDVVIAEIQQLKCADSGKR